MEQLPLFGFLSQEKGLFAGHCFREGGVQPKFLGKLGFKIGLTKKPHLYLCCMQDTFARATHSA